MARRSSSWIDSASVSMHSTRTLCNQHRFNRDEPGLARRRPTRRAHPPSGRSAGQGEAAGRGRVLQHDDGLVDLAILLSSFRKPGPVRGPSLTSPSHQTCQT
jgi:hypothetical protein